jgi:hypothetical protein
VSIFTDAAKRYLLENMDTATAGRMLNLEDVVGHTTLEGVLEVRVEEVVVLLKRPWWKGFLRSIFQEELHKRARILIVLLVDGVAFIEWGPFDIEPGGSVRLEGAKLTTDVELT